MAYDRLKIISGNGNLPLAESIAQYSGVKLVDRLCGSFPDGETRVRILESIRGDDVFVVQSTRPGHINDDLQEALFIAHDAFRCGAERVTGVFPYFGYSRQDRSTGREPLSFYLVSEYCKLAGISRFVFIDLHNPSLQNVFGWARTIMDVPSKYLFSNRLKFNDDYKNFVGVAPDSGGAKRTRELANLLGLQMAYIDKERDPVTGKSKPVKLVGDVVGKTVVIVEDLIATGGTLADTIALCKKNGANKVIACAPHALLVGEACSKLTSCGLDELMITDTLPLPDEKRQQLKTVKLTELSWAERLAERVIIPLHTNKPTTHAFEE